MAVSTINGSKFAVVEGTLSDTVSAWSDMVPYPTGFTLYNSVLVGFSVKIDAIYWRTGQGLMSSNAVRIFAELAPGGVRAYSSESSFVSHPFRVVLMKNS